MRAPHLHLEQAPSRTAKAEPPGLTKMVQELPAFDALREQYARRPLLANLTLGLAVIQRKSHAKHKAPAMPRIIHPRNSASGLEHRPCDSASAVALRVRASYFYDLLLVVVDELGAVQ